MLNAGVGLHAEDEFTEEDWASDDVTGRELGATAVRAARHEDMSFIQGSPLYEEASVEECWSRTGKAPISAMWVDIEKGDEVRSRWVARYFKPKGKRDRADLFAAMPPLEAKRMLFRRFAVMKNLNGKRKMKLMLIDVKKAHLNGVCERDNVYVELPQEGGAPGTCGRLLRWFYGMREAASAWEAAYTSSLKGDGFVEGASAPTVFPYPQSGTRCVVHGDEFTFLGCGDELDNIEEKMAEWYEPRVRGVLGTDEGDAKKISILNRETEVTEFGLVYRADPKRAQIIWGRTGLTRESRGATTAFVREDVEGDDVVLDVADKTFFTHVAARANYLSLDRPDMQFAVNGGLSPHGLADAGGRQEAQTPRAVFAEAPRGGASLPLVPRGGARDHRRLHGFGLGGLPHDAQEHKWRLGSARWGGRQVVVQDAGDRSAEQRRGRVLFDGERHRRRHGAADARPGPRVAPGVASLCGFVCRGGDRFEEGLRGSPSA